MSDRYPFTGDRAFTHSGALVWNDQVAVQPTLDFSHVSDSTLTDSMNDSYATAVEDNETQYLSVLETTNDITLDDLHNMTLENSKMTTQENLQLETITPMENLETNASDTNDQQVIVFSIEGSDELYGIQFAQDEEGNTQRYQFKFRTTDDGQLEAIPESIQLLANDLEQQQKDADGEILVQQAVHSDETEVTETQVVYQEETGDDALQETRTVFEVQGPENLSEEEQIRVEQHNDAIHMFIKGEPRTDGGHEEDEEADAQIYMEGSMRDEEVEEGQQYAESETEMYLEKEFEEEETVDVKAGILEENSAGSNIKQEMFQEESHEVTGGEPLEEEEYQMYNHRHLDIKPVPYTDANAEEEISSPEEDAEHHLEDNVEVDNGYVDVDEAQETVLEYEHYVPEDIQHVYEVGDTVNEQGSSDTVRRHRFDRVFIKQETFRKSHRSRGGGPPVEDEGDEEEQDTYYAEAATENDSDNDDYQIVEGLHVTAEGDIDEEEEEEEVEPASPPYQHEPVTILQEVIERPAPVLERANILKQSTLPRGAKAAVKNSGKTVVYYVVPHVEKENVNSLPVNYNTTTATVTAATYRPIRSNPRSILKSSFTSAAGAVPEAADMKTVVGDEWFNKRFARSKEAVQARLFNNFISRTTIPHAPVRQTRLPRKQQIKPVDNRRDEEIIVQEVMVGSNGFIENVEDKLKNKEKLEVTQYVILSDSDEDYDPKKGTKKKKKHKKHTRNGMDDPEDSDISVIEIRSDDDETAIDDRREHTKRGRGRPKKSLDLPSSRGDSTKRRRGRPPKSGHSDADESSPQKKSRTESDEIEESDTAKKEFKCPHCTKTFPSQNSLSTHLHHHSLENSLRNSQANRAAAAAAAKVEYRHKCDACQETFKNSILLKRHACPKLVQKASKTVECGVCKKRFDLAALKVHKRLHIKENLVSTTAVAKVSPKKVSSRPSIATRPNLRSPRKAGAALKPAAARPAVLKCKDCSRVCFSQESLDLHEKTHRKYTCPSCNATFPSRLLLDAHVRLNCVKASPRTGSRRLSFKIRKSYVPSPRRRTATAGAVGARKSLAPSRGGTGSGAAANNAINLNLECEHCSERFNLFQHYFRHQVTMHGLETPDKSILQEQTKRLHRPKALHGGIPAREGMRKVFAEIRSKMALITPKKDSH